MIKYTITKSTLKKFIESLAHDKQLEASFRRRCYGSTRYSADQLVEALAMVLETDERSYDAFRRALDCDEYRGVFARGGSEVPGFVTPLQAWRAFRSRAFSNETQVFITSKQKKKAKDANALYAEQAEAFSLEKTSKRAELRVLVARIKKRIKLSAGAKTLIQNEFTGLSSLL